jgi:hypothetical protein
MEIYGQFTGILREIYRGISRAFRRHSEHLGNRAGWRDWTGIVMGIAAALLFAYSFAILFSIWK